jgi:carboxymethylenebutenolidase
MSPALDSDHNTSVAGAVIYVSSSSAAQSLSPSSVPLLLHVAGPSPSAGASTERTEAVTKYFYPEATSALFAQPFQDHFSYRTEALSHTRSLSFLKPRVGGPYFDLETIWEEHAWYEFGDRSVEHTMSTMVAEPYVNHVTTVGSASLPSPFLEVSTCQVS